HQVEQRTYLPGPWRDGDGARRVPVRPADGDGHAALETLVTVTMPASLRAELDRPGVSMRDWTPAARGVLVAPLTDGHDETAGPPDARVPGGRRVRVRAGRGRRGRRRQGARARRLRSRPEREVSPFREKVACQGRRSWWRWSRGPSARAGRVVSLLPPARVNF